MGQLTDRRYSVAVVATLSAGKSTLLNSMMCNNLLPSKNEACTATIFKIEDDDEGRKHNFSGRYKDKNGWSDWHAKSINSDLLQEWNRKAPQEIELSGNLPNISNTPEQVKVCFVDTPGPNNAMCDEHARITERVIAENDFSTLCFVINSSVAGVKDEWRLLFELQKQLSTAKKSQQIIFILNKIDLLDIEKGEKITQAVSMCRNYLEKEIGFKNPIVIPVCSKLALEIRTAIRTAKRLTQQQRCKLQGIKYNTKKKSRRMSRSYKCRFPERQQMELAFFIDLFAKFSDEYKEALSMCEQVAELMPEYETRTLSTPTRKIYIHDRFYSYKDLYDIEALTGVGYLEKIVEKHCFAVVPKLEKKPEYLIESSKAKKVIDSIDEDTEEDFISDEELDIIKPAPKTANFSREEISKLPQSTQSKSNQHFFISFEYLAEPGMNVLIACSANNWEASPMVDKYNTGAYQINLLLPVGTHYYKFDVDGEWVCLPDNKYVYGKNNESVNVIEVKPQSKESSEMLQVNIKYNPYLVTTELSLDNIPVAKNSTLEVLTQDRLQNWIDKFLPALYEEKRQKNIEICFEGTQFDYNDLLDAVEDFQKNNPGFYISFSEQISKQNNEHRLNNLRSLFEEGKKGPFAEMFNSEAMEKAFERATDPTFEVNVIATMSSGKSTVVNAFLGKELMPAKNEACTATIARITDNDARKGFVAQRFDKEGKPLSEPVAAAYDKLTKWNDDPKTHIIEVEGDIPTVNQTFDCTYVFVDTPGPNNARTAAHEQATLEAIQSKPLSMVLYVLNATQLSTRDDDSLLKMVCREMNKGGRKANDRFVFIANKIDTFDPGKNELVSSALENVKQYLRDNGIQNPIVIPASAQLAKLIRRERNGAELTDMEHMQLDCSTSSFTKYPEMNMLNHCKSRLSKNCIRSLEKRLEEARAANDKRKIAEILSGIPIVEELLNDFLKKHALPAKLKDAVDTFSQVMQASTIARALNDQLAKSEEELAATVGAIKKFTNDKENINKAKKFREKVKTIKYERLSKDSEDTCTALIQISDKLITDMDNNFSEGKATPTEAKHLIAKAVQECRSLEAEVNVTLNKALENEYFAVMDNLRNEYQEYAAKIVNENFPDNESLRFLQKTSMELPLTSEMVMDHIQIEQIKAGTKKVKVGTEQVKIGTKQVKVGTEKVKVGEEQYIKSYRTERIWYTLWLAKREVPVYSWRDIFESKDIYDTQDIFEARDVFEEQDVMEERKMVNLTPISKRVAQTIRKFTRENIVAFEENARLNVKQASVTLLRLMDVIDERISKISNQLETASANKEKKELLVAENRKKVEWYNDFRKKIEDVLAI